MLLFQEVPEASGWKVGGAFGGLGGVNLGVSEVGQPFTIGCHPPCEKKKIINLCDLSHMTWIHIKSVERSARFQWSVTHTHPHTLQVYNNFLAVREQVGKVSKGKAIFCSLETLVLLSSVVGQFDKVSEHVGLHCYTAHNLISIQNLFTGTENKRWIFNACLCTRIILLQR